MFSWFENLILPFPKGEPSRPPDELLKFCLHYTRGLWLPIAAMSLFMALSAMAEALLFAMVGRLVDWLAAADPETFFVDKRNALLALGLLLVVGVPLVTLIHSLLVHQTMLGNYPMSIRWRAHQYLLKQSFAFYQNDFAGRVATKLLQTSLSVRETVMKVADVLVYILVYFATMVVIFAQADVRLAVPLVGWLVCYIGILTWILPRLRKVSAMQAEARSTMTGRIVDSYTNIQTVKLFAHTEREAAYAKEGMADFMDTVHLQMRWVTLLNVSVHWLNYLLVFVVIALSLYLWSLSVLTVGAIGVAIAMALRLNGMAHWIMWEVSALFENIGTVMDGMQTLSQPREVVDHPDAQPMNVTQGNIEFQAIRFHYGKPSGGIERLDLAIAAGEKVGLVGRSGAGKSTLMNLLLRFYDVEAGQILIDQQNIKTVAQESLRAQIGVVTQDTMLLHRSVRDNILYGRPDATEAELIEACRKAEAWRFIPSLVDSRGNEGLDAFVGERGVKLSGGQRQRIAIARVLLKDAPILVLDEATSALDSDVEAAIQENLYQLMTGKTVIAIAHRLSTIAAMDRLVVMDAGTLVEQGSHAELIALNGLYAQLWYRQTGGFLGEL